MDDLGCTKGGLNPKLHAVCNASGQPIVLHLTEGQASDYKGTAVLLDSLTQSRKLLADRGDDADWFRKALLSKGIAPCIPDRRSWKKLVSYDKELFKQRHKIEIMLDRLKAWHRIVMRYDRCAPAFFSAIYIAASVIFCL